MSYPILVARYDGAHPSDRLACIGSCGREWGYDPSGGCLECQCGGALVPVYELADTCGGCGALGHYAPALNHCCSRACMLQAEYAESLKRVETL